MTAASLPFGPVVGLRLNPGILGVIQSGEHLPVESSGVDGVFTDRFDADHFWWLPALQPAPAPDAAFGFSASAVGVSGSSGLPLYSADVTFGLVTTQPAGLAAAIAAHPGATFDMIPATSLDVSLTVVAKTDDGQDEPQTFAAVLTGSPGGSYVATVTLVGPAVTVAYESLTATANATLTVNYAYAVWRSWRPIFLPPIGISMPPILIQPPVLGSAPDGAEPGNLPKIGIDDGGPILFPPHPINGGDGNGNPAPLPDPIWVTATDQSTATIPLGATFGADGYRPRYTVTTGSGADAQTRPIIDASDLTGFATARSEFVELTSLGDPSARYPSIRRLYFGLASGRIVVVPQSFLIRRGSAGLGATLQAAIDDSPGTHVSGARFEFTFTLAPGLDATDYAQLVQDIPAIPEAAGRTLSIAVATGLDPRTPASFTGFSACTSQLVDGSAPSTLDLRVTIVDVDQTPALDLVNLFLRLLGGVVSPMGGEVAVRLDDLYSAPVTTALALQLASTAAGDELAVTATSATTVQVQNLSPLPLQLLGAAAITSGGPQPVAVSSELPGNATTAIEVGDATVPLAIRAELDLGTSSGTTRVLDFLTVQVETTQSIRHAFSFNALAAFPAPVTQLDLVMSLVAAPEVTIPSLTLTVDHRLDSVSFAIPIVTALTDLSCAIAVTVTDGGPARHAMITHDFAADPILIIQASDVEAAQPAG